MKPLYIGAIAVVVLLIVSLGIYLLFFRKKADFRYLGSVYSPTVGGSRGEFQEECLNYPGNGFCMLTDGSPGVCVMSGQCVASMISDHRLYKDDVGLPYCGAKPVFKDGCKRFCKCQGKGGDCEEKCRSWFSPL